jgi:hypothetical protein
VRCLRREVAAIERQQPLPVPFGGIAVVDRALREGKAVMGLALDDPLPAAVFDELRDIPGVDSVRAVELSLAG